MLLRCCTSSDCDLHADGVFLSRPISSDIKSPKEVGKRSLVILERGNSLWNRKDAGRLRRVRSACVGQVRMGAGDVDDESTTESAQDVEMAWKRWPGGHERKPGGRMNVTA